MARHIRGTTLRTSVKIGASDLTYGTPIKIVDGLAVAAGDGDDSYLVMHENGAAGEDNKVADVLIPGAVWGFTAGADLARGTKVALAANGQVDAGTPPDDSAGTPGDPSIGVVIDKDVTAGQEARVMIRPGTIG